MNHNRDPYRSFDDASLAHLATLIAGSRGAVLATVDNGAPYAAVAAYAPESDYAGFLLHLSDLAAHKRHLRADPRAALIIVEPDDGRTEILQHKRVTLTCRAVFIPRQTEEFDTARELYLARFPKHQLMFTLGDFDLVRLVPEGGLLNAGFGQAYRVTPAELAAASRLGGKAE